MTPCAAPAYDMTHLVPEVPNMPGNLHCRGVSMRQDATLPHAVCDMPGKARSLLLWRNWFFNEI